MQRTATLLEEIRAHYTGEKRDLLRVLLNSTSAAEANLALDALQRMMPEKVLVSACNLREVVRALPSSPFTMRVDEDTLIDAGGLTRHIAVLSKELPDGLAISLTTAGNLVLDIIIRSDAERYFWNPIPVTDDFVNGDVLDHLIQSDHLLHEIINLTKLMGMVFNARFYLSLEDWLLESAADAYESIRDIFSE